MTVIKADEWDWPERTVRGEYDSDHDRIVCQHCPWCETGGPTSCGWAYHDHLEEQHGSSTDN